MILPFAISLFHLEKFPALGRHSKLDNRGMLFGFHSKGMLNNSVFAGGNPVD